MPIPANKEDLRSDILSSYMKLRMELESIAPEATILPELSGHAKDSKASIHNLVSYLIGWGHLVLKWHKGKASGLAVDFPETGYKWNELGRLAEKFYADYRGLSYNELLPELDRVVREIIALIESHTNEELYREPWYEHYTMGRMIQLNTSSPYKNTRLRVRKWKTGLKGVTRNNKDNTSGVINV